MGLTGIADDWGFWWIGAVEVTILAYSGVNSVHFMLSGYPLLFGALASQPAPL
jgi:hypothetical protein